MLKWYVKEIACKDSSRKDNSRIVFTKKTQKEINFLSAFFIKHILNQPRASLSAEW